MIEILNQNKTCAFTGHRILYKNFDEKKVEKKILSVVKEGYKVFLCGMALGFDLTCAKIIIKLKEKFDVKLVACIPCVNQDKGYNLKQKEEYAEILSKADEKIVLEQNYTPTCMQKRNKFMVDNSSLVIAYLCQERGGTVNTVNYAIKQNKQVIYV